MQTKLETPPEKFEATTPTRAVPSNSWLPLIGAIILLPFANGANAIALAAWLAPFFLLRFVRTHRVMVGFPVVVAVQCATLAFQYRGMLPFPTPIYAAVIIAYAIFYTLPYLGDRLWSHRLSRFSGTLIFPLILASVEYLISLGPFGSWFATAYSQYGNLALLQILSVTGLWGIAFLIGWAAAAGNALWEEWSISRRIPRVATGCALLIIATMLAGGARLALFPPAGKAVRVATLSGIRGELHPDPKVVGRFFRNEPLAPDEMATIRTSTSAVADDLLERSEREAKAGARIIFWGEANAPVLKEDESDLIRRGGVLAKANGIYLGMLLASWHRETKPPLENKIVLIQPDGTPAWEFFKAHPVPGGEASISIRGDGKLRALDTPYGRLSSVICFDADFPQLLAQAGRLRADILLDPSNDWKAIDPWHTRMASFRAIEQGFNLVRHTSQGLSAAFDYQGRELASMDHYTASDRVLIAQVPTRGTLTIYAMLGDWFAWACLVGLAGLLIFAAKTQPLRRISIILLFAALAIGTANADDQLPSLPATTLSGAKMLLPSNLPTRPILFLIGFSRTSRAQTDVWSRRLENDKSLGAVTYDVAVIEGVPALIRALVVMSIRSSVPKSMHDRFLLVTEKSAEWRKLSSFDQPDAAYLVLLDRNHKVRWHSSGEMTEDLYRALTKEIGK